MTGYKYNFKFIIEFIFAAVLCCLIIIPVNGATVPPAGHIFPGSRSYLFGVLPQFEQRKLYAIWDPIIKELEKRTGLSFELVTALNVGNFEGKFVKGVFDFVYMNPYHVLKAAGTQGYIPLVRDKVPLRGILVAAKDGPVRSVYDLNGKVVAFPSPNELGASLLMRADLERLFHVRVQPLYVGTHRSVYLHVANGLTAAGGGLARTLTEQDEAVLNSLRVIYTTRAMPAHPVAAHPRVPARDREKVRKALLDMGKTPEGRELLSKIPIERITSASLGDYRVMYGWGLESYWNPLWR